MPHNHSMGRMLPHNKETFPEADSVAVGLLLVAQTMVYQQGEVPLLETPAMCLVDPLLDQVEADRIDELPQAVLHRTNRDLPKQLQYLLVDL